MSQHGNSEVNVAIIGAGVAGLRCADILLCNGAKVKIYEARDRIGGRVSQIRCGGQLVDLGANWIHSPHGNPILQLANKVEATTFERPGTQAVIGSDGIRRSDEVAALLQSKRVEVIDKAHRYSYKHSSQIDPDASLMDFFRDEVSKECHDEPAILQDLLGEAQRFGQFVGEPIDQQSLKFLCIEESPGGTDLFVASTYERILALIAQPALEKNVIQCNAEVKNITSETTSEGSFATVETADGIRQTFSEVVVTCPLGWLKKHKEAAFTPALPPRLCQAIGNIKQVTQNGIFESR